MGAQVVNCSWFVGYFAKDADDQYYDIDAMLDLMTSYSDTLYVCAAAPNTPSVKLTDITTSTVTVQIKVPYESMCGNGLYVYDFTDQVWFTNTNQWNLSSGTYTITGLKPGHKYDVQLYWYTDQDTYWAKRSDRMNYCTAALTNGASILTINPTRTSTYLKVTYPPSATHRYYIAYIHEDENGDIVNEYVPNSDRDGTYYVGGLIPEKFYNCYLCWDNADGELETLMIQLYLE